jgi:predicted dehydrogenase
MPETLNVAVVGCGIGRSHIQEAYQADPDRFRVAALCDLNRERLDEVGDEFGVERRITAFDELLAMDDIDIIDICTPPAVHYQQIMAALAAGKNVICEKPLVGSLKQMDEVMEAERRSKGRLMPIFQYRYGDGAQKARKIIESGIAGKPYVGTAETFWLRLPDYYTVAWRGKWETELGGVLMTHAIHIHDMFMWLMGRPKSLFGRVATRVHTIEVEDCISASMELESGALGSLTATLGAREEISRLHLAFENVTFESSHFPYSLGDEPWRIVPRDEKTKAEIDALLSDWQPVPRRFGGQMRDFHAAIVDGKPLPVTTEDARAGLELVAAFYHSAQTGGDVPFPIGANHPFYESWIPQKTESRSA